MLQGSPRRAVRLATCLGLGVLVASTLVGCQGGTGQGKGTSSAGSDSATSGQPLLLVSYSVTKRAYDKILPKFQADWKRRTGQSIEVKTSYGASGSQTRAVIDGLEADVVTLALPADVLKLEKAGLVQPGWQAELPEESTITRRGVTAGLPRAERCSCRAGSRAMPLATGWAPARCVPAGRSPEGSARG